MAKKIARMGDVDSGGGSIISINQSTVFANNRLVSIDGSRVSSHPSGSLHGSARTANGEPTIVIGGIPVNGEGDADTCGHVRVDGSSNVFIGNTSGSVSALPPLFINDDNDEAARLDRQSTRQQPNECNEGYLARAGNPGDLNGVGEDDKNKIATISVPVNTDTLAVNVRFEMTPGSDSVTQWTLDNPVGGLTLDAVTGAYTGTVTAEGEYTITVHAVGAQGELDSRFFKVVARRQSTSDTIQFKHPLPGAVVTSGVSPARSVNGGKPRPHRGIDLAYVGGRLGKVLASADGKVEYAGWFNGYGNTVILSHSSSSQVIAFTTYAHMKELFVRVNQDVTQGTVVGFEGNTGVGTGPHLHFEIRGPSFFAGRVLNQQASVLDPAQYLDKVGLDTNVTKKDPSDAQPPNITRENNNRVGYTKTSQPCVAYVSPAADDTSTLPVTPSPYKPEAVIAGETPSQQQVIDRMNAVMDAHPELTPEDRQFLLNTAKIESSFNPNAKNPKSSATGLFQMTNATAAGVGLTTLESRTNVEQATEAAITHYKTNLEPLYTSFHASGGLTMGGQPVTQNAWTNTLRNVDKGTFIYGALWHDGSGNTRAGKDLGGVDYWQNSLRTGKI